jgi:hypothetical protein
MVSSRSVNQPFGLNQALLCVGDGGMRKNVAIPIKSVIKPLEKVRSIIHSMNEEIV